MTAHARLPISLIIVAVVVAYITTEVLAARRAPLEDGTEMELDN